ncbi:hypothetical protein HDU97_005153 [Phlyctochytrium planicorne]|nr:hypothetical protein HDU97_005153 [Phlyctochytrium planicorne]
MRHLACLLRTQHLCQKQLPARLSPLSSFSTTSIARSRIGQKPIRLPSNVTVTVENVDPTPQNPRITRQITVKGPLATLSMPIQSFIEVHQPSMQDLAASRAKKYAGLEESAVDGEDDAIEPELHIKVENPKDRSQKTMWGTTRALVRNMVEGVSEGFTVPIQLVGVGYRAALEPPPKELPGQAPGRPKVALKLGYSHPVELEVPEGVQVRIPVPQRMIVQGSDLGVITQFAAKIRAWRPPEPYNQKGVFVGGETIKKKEGKKR